MGVRDWQKRLERLEGRLPDTREDVEGHQRTEERRAEKEKEQRAKEQATEKLIKERQERREQEMKDSARNSFLYAGGSEEDFEEAWPEIKAEMLKQRTLEGETQARELQRASGVSRI